MLLFLLRLCYAHTHGCSHSPKQLCIIMNTALFSSKRSFLPSTTKHHLVSTQTKLFFSWDVSTNVFSFHIRFESDLSYFKVYPLISQLRTTLLIYLSHLQESRDCTFHVFPWSFSFISPTGSSSLRQTASIFHVISVKQSFLCALVIPVFVE